MMLDIKEYNKTSSKCIGYQATRNAFYYHTPISYQLQYRVMLVLQETL